jgi:SAM-dependent methyltransferase
MNFGGANEGRLQKEAAFHDEWANSVDVAQTLVDETFTANTAIENQHVLKQFGNLQGKRVLDYGCGAAEGGIYFAKQGAIVTAIDVSAGMLSLAERLAKHHGVSIETRQVNTDRIPAENDEFDYIYGNGVLHHVPLDTAMPEIARILRPAGRACFIEPLPYNPVINVYRKIAKDVRTDDERPLTFGQIDRFRNQFGEVDHSEFWLSTLAVFLKFFVWDRVDPNKERYWKKIYTDAQQIDGLFTPLHKLDQKVLALAPWMGGMCWNTVITLAEPKKV